MQHCYSRAQRTSRIDLKPFFSFGTVVLDLKFRSLCFLAVSQWFNFLSSLGDTHRLRFVFLIGVRDGGYEEKSVNEYRERNIV